MGPPSRSGRPRRPVATLPLEAKKETVMPIGQCGEWMRVAQPPLAPVSLIPGAKAMAMALLSGRWVTMEPRLMSMATLPFYRSLESSRLLVALVLTCSKVAEVSAKPSCRATSLRAERVDTQSLLGQQ